MIIEKNIKLSCFDVVRKSLGSLDILEGFAFINHRREIIMILLVSKRWTHYSETIAERFMS